MRYNMYAYYDRVANMYSQPILQTNDASAQRIFNYMCQQAPDKMEDMQLYMVGTFDVITGEVVAENKPLFICNFVKPVEVVEDKENEQ